MLKANLISGLLISKQTRNGHVRTIGHLRYIFPWDTTEEKIKNLVQAEKEVQATAYKVQVIYAMMLMEFDRLSYVSTLTKH